jgi:CubicO group peptidase (beta-lactamase class C family)
VGGVLLAVSSAAAVSPLAAQDAASLTALVDRAIARAVTTGGAGCSVGLSLGDARVTRSAGLADLERSVALTPASIIEAGSVSKQFTAAAVLLLALDGKVDLDADVRRWIPELPAYDAPVTVRHLLTHTSGLRDWGAVVQLEGWPRGARAHTNAHVLQVAARQRALNYTPGATYSYTNTGYNLLAILVERVSGQSLAAFTRERLFTPLGMASTSWRDDHRRVVPGRALAYGAGTTPRLSMPDESAYGNGGLLTTADDLLRWVNALNTRALGAPFADSLVRRMVLTRGDTIDYALGVNVLAHRGTHELSHSGSTGGYRAHLLAFPERHAGVAVLCNGAGLNATQLAEQLADSVIGPRARRANRSAPFPRPVAAAAARASISPAEHAQLAGTYASDEVQGEPYTVAVEQGALVLRQAPATRLVLVPTTGSHFQASGQLVWFDRDATGRATALHVASDRAWDVTFTRVR